MENDNIPLAVKAAFVAFAGAFGAAFGWLGWLILAWVLCMVLDWLSGSAAASAKGNWSSATARAGIWHKGGMILVIIVAALADCVLGVSVNNLPMLGINYTVLVLPVTLVWYIFTELGSIAENATEMGANVPVFLTKILAAGKTITENAMESQNEEVKK